MNIKQQLYKIPVVRRLHYKYNEIKNKKIRQQNIAMMHIGRVGSTVIGDMMNQHPDIFWDGEPFEKLMRIGSEKPDNFVETTIRKSQNKQISKLFSFATKFLPEQHLWEECIDMDLESYIKLLQNMGFKRYIIIKRKNYLRQVISILVGEKKKKWHSKKEVNEATKINVPINNFESEYKLKLPLIDYFNRIDRQYSLLEEILNPDQVLIINYEKDIMNDPFKAYNKVCGFMGVKSLSPKINFRKTNPFLLNEMIDNFEEVKMSLKNTKYSWMLEH